MSLKKKNQQGAPSSRKIVSVNGDQEQQQQSPYQVKKRLSERWKCTGLLPIKTKKKRWNDAIAIEEPSIS